MIIDNFALITNIKMNFIVFLYPNTPREKVLLQSLYFVYIYIYRKHHLFYINNTVLYYLLLRLET